MFYINKSAFIENSLDNQFLYNQVSCCIKGCTQLLLSYSGGLDSTVLLDILTTLMKCGYSTSSAKFKNFFSLRAVYVDHGLNANTVKWSHHCAQQCKIRNIPFHIIRINYHNINQKSSNVESIARFLRYRELCNCLSSKETLLTAHHMDDQVETVFLALKRGSGPAGLSGIHEKIILHNNRQILRPLLECSKSQLKLYAHEKKLVWVEDSMNKNIRFDRNFFRIKIIPLLKKRWPTFHTVVKRTAKICKNQEILLKELLLNSLSKLTDLDGFLLYKPLLEYSDVKRQALLRYWLSNFIVYMPSYQLLNRIWKEVILSKPDSCPILYLGEYICRRFRQKLYILPNEMACSVNFVSLSWNHLLNNIISLPYNLGLLSFQRFTTNTICEYSPEKVLENQIDANFLSDIFFNYFKISGKILTNCLVREPTTQEIVSIRFGENIKGLLHIVGRKRGRKLKKIWQELNVPPWLRSRIPLLFYNNTLIAAVGIFITVDGQFKNNSSFAWKIYWIQNKLYYNCFMNAVCNFLK